MYKKPLFTEKELKAAFDGSDYQKYSIIKKYLAKTYKVFNKYYIRGNNIWY